MPTLPSHSRAAVLRRFGEPLRIEEVPVPKEIEPGAILARIETCSVCGTDVHLSRGSLSLKVDLPVIIGHEMVGRVVALGAGADRDTVGNPLRVGDRIVWTHTACNSCFYCTVARQPTLCENRKAYMYESMEKPPFLMGGFSEYGYVLPESGRIRVPDSVPNELASLSSCAFRSVMNAVGQVGAIAPYETVAIQGAGPLGLLATAVAKVAGARRVIVIGGPAARLDLASAFGADETIPVDGTDPVTRAERVRELTDGRGADIVMEFTGHPTAFAEGLEIARKGGRYLVVGQLGDGSVEVKPAMVVKKNLHLIGSFSGDAANYWKALQFVEAHQHHLPFERMISNRYKLEDVNTALERMRRFEEIKPIIEI
ncbi:zinc-binding dehydrogenase [Arenibaculum pallidiluteum]|uniref:zinc-binding dehydrogenase n=1 Tax=Arenibaculum pallidiluteum TaxID=2812559 RepID=UPI001A975825|nr:zinc-binding dehydrogenase [Arenibaculum pallidiluteum]